MAQEGVLVPGVDPEKDEQAFAAYRHRMDSIRQHRPTVALVLSGGGAKGMAHLGVIRLLEELNIPVDLVGGNSMGALVAGLYALGYSADELESLVRSFDWSMMMSDNVPKRYIPQSVRADRERFPLNLRFHYDDLDYAARIEEMRRHSKMAEKADLDVGRQRIAQSLMGIPDGLLEGFNIRNVLASTTVGYQDSLSFLDLPVPFFCVATDLYRPAAKYWTSGNLLDALRSSMSIPIFFRPVRIGDMILVDGMSVDNYPVDIARAMGADIVIGSEFAVEKGLEDFNDLSTLGYRNLTIWSDWATDKCLADTDIDIRHDLESKGYGSLSFDSESVDGIITEGVANAEAHRAELESLAKRLGPRQRETRPHTNILKERVRIGAITCNGLTPEEEKRLLGRHSGTQDNLWGAQEIQNILARIYATGAFESVTYRLEGASEPYRFVIDCRKGQTNMFSLGLHADTDEYLYFDGAVGIGTERLSGWRITTEFKIGSNPELDLTLAYKPLRLLPLIGLTVRNRIVNYTVAEGQTLLWNAGADLFLKDVNLSRGKMKLGLSAEMSPLRQDYTSHWISGFVNAGFDTFDDGAFPHRGVRTGANGRYVFAGMAGGRWISPYGIVQGNFSAAIPLGRFTVQPTVYAGWSSSTTTQVSPLHSLYAGGFLASRYYEFQVPYIGYRHGAFASGQKQLMAQLDLRAALSSKAFISLQGAGLMTDGAAGTQAPDSSYAIGLEAGLKTIAGPLKLNVNRCSSTGWGAFLSFGMDF